MNGEDSKGCSARMHMPCNLISLDSVTPVVILLRFHLPPIRRWQARAAGMHSVGVLWGANGEEALVDHFDFLVSDTRGLGEAIRNALESKA